MQYWAEIYKNGFQWVEKVYRKVFENFEVLERGMKKWNWILILGLELGEVILNA